MSGELERQKKKLAGLIEERWRRGKKRLSKIERLKMLEEVYDGSLYWLLQAVASGSPKGTGAATMVLERARLEMVELQRTGLCTDEGADNGQVIIDFELPSLTGNSFPDA